MPRTEKPKVDDLIGAAVEYLRLLPPSARPSILGPFLIWANVPLEQFDDETMLAAAEALFAPTEGIAGAGLARQGALIKGCALMDFVYLQHEQASPHGATAAAIMQRPDIAARIPLHLAQLKKAADEWRSLRRTMLSTQSILEAE
jgi:hypothetical protein